MKNNNAMHYKMYKAKKNIVFAGLATTAVLAGLTLSNVNNTAHADTVSGANTTAVASTSASSAQIASASAALSSAANNKSEAQSQC